MENNSAGQLLNRLTFTNKEVADFTGVTESMVKKIRLGKSPGSNEVQQKIREFVRLKVERLNGEIKTSSLFPVDDV